MGLATAIIGGVGAISGLTNTIIQSKAQKESIKDEKSRNLMKSDNTQIYITVGVIIVIVIALVFIFKNE